MQEELNEQSSIKEDEINFLQQLHLCGCVLLFVVPYSASEGVVMKRCSFLFF